ncbi:MAG: hypothetical protein WCR66_05380 [Bacteroidota bacterium]
MYLNIKGIRMKKINGIMGCLLLLTLAACNKEISNNNGFTPYANNPLNDTVWITNIPGDAPIYKLADTIFHNNALEDTFDLAKGKVLNFGDSLEIEIHPNSFFVGTGNPGSGGGIGGTATDGKATIEILRIQTRGDFIKAYRPNNSFGSLLETASGFFIRVEKNGQELMLLPDSTLKIKYSDIQDPVSNMQVFYGRETFPFPNGALDEAHTWVRDQDPSWIKTFVKQSGNSYKKGYELVAKRLRWISAERYLDSTVAKTNIYAILPPNYTNKNTQVFVALDKNRTVLALNSDISTRSFTTKNIPLKAKITLVSISKIGDDFYLGTKVVNDVGTVINYSITPEKKTLGQILDYINSL